MSIADKILIGKRALIETVNDELKNIAQIEHSRHRSFNNFVANTLSAIMTLFMVQSFSENDIFRKRDMVTVQCRIQP